MKKALSVLWLALCFAAKAQNLNQVSFTGGSNVSSIAFLTDQGVLVRVSLEGHVLEYGREVQALRSNYYAPQLQPFMGRIDYYGPESDSAYRGKIRNIGTCAFTWFGKLETPEKQGKLKSIGVILIDYYTRYDNASAIGKIKMAGSQVFDYYASFENEAFRGKLKSIGNTPISYYSSFDDKLIRGKLKSIGSFPYAWYTSLDRREYAGALKTGSQRQGINGIIYILR